MKSMLISFILCILIGFNILLTIDPISNMVETVQVNSDSKPMTNYNSAQFGTSSLPVKRSSNFTYSSMTIAEYPVQNTVPQKSALANSTLLSDMVSLTIDHPITWRNFSLASGENFLAIDGASQSMVLMVLIEVYSPDGYLKVAKNTTASEPLHYVCTNPLAGEWKIRLTLVNIGNTTAWVQAISLNGGAKFIQDYHKESLHMFAGQAVYFRVPITTRDWFDIFAQKLAGGYMIFELFLPTDYLCPWQSSLESFDNFFSSSSIPKLGTYLFVARNYEYGGGDADIVIQITKPNGVVRILSANDKISLRFNMTNENEFFYVNINQAFQWFALDGGVTTTGSVRYLLRKPDTTIVADLFSYSYEYPISFMVVEPQIGNYLLVVRGSQKDVVATIQITTNGGEKAIISKKADVNITFQQTGQTLYYIIDTASISYFVFSGLSLNGHIIYKIFNFRYEQIWVAESWGSASPQSILQVPVGNRYLLSIQGQKLSSAMIHVRFNGNEDFFISPPDYSDFEMRFSGDFILYKLNVPNVDYFLQYWHNFAPNYIVVEIYDANYVALAKIELWYFDAEARLMWRKGLESYTPGSWLVFLTGEKGQPIRVSQLKAGDEERTVTTPFHVFETFDFDGQAKTFKINIPPCTWLSVVVQLQTDVQFYFRMYDFNLQQVWEVYTDYRYQPYHGFWKNPSSGKWLVVVDGLSSTNASLTFQSSQDPMEALLTGVSKSEHFEYYGDAKYYRAVIEESSFIGFGGMSLSDHTHFAYLISSAGDVFYSIQIYGRFNIFHNFAVINVTGTWFIILLGQLNSKLMIRLSIKPDAIFDIPSEEREIRHFFSEYDGKITYESFDIKTSNIPFQLNITSSVDVNSWVFLYEPDGGPFYYYGNGYIFHLYQRGQIETITIYQPKLGRWTIAVIQEVFANITMSIAYMEVLPPPPPYGVLVDFIQPQDVQAYLVNGSILMSSKVSGNIKVVVNVTDFYHSIVEVILYYNGGRGMTNMIFNYTSQYYEVEFDTTKFDDGLYELVVYARCNAGEVGIASISILIDNHSEYPIISEFPSLAFFAITFFGLLIASIIVKHKIMKK